MGKAGRCTRCHRRGAYSETDRVSDLDVPAKIRSSLVLSGIRPNEAAMGWDRGRNVRSFPPIVHPRHGARRLPRFVATPTPQAGCPTDGSGNSVRIPRATFSQLSRSCEPVDRARPNKIRARHLDSLLTVALFRSRNL